MALLARLEKLSGTRVITAFGAVLQALEHLSVHKVALGTPYAEDTSLKGSAPGSTWPASGRLYRLDHVQNIYDETLSAPTHWRGRSIPRRQRRYS